MAVHWEMAAWAPGLIDLGALVTGWSAGQRAEIVGGFGGADGRDLAAAKLFLAAVVIKAAPAVLPTPRGLAGT